MKILAIGDFHGKFPEKLKKEARKVDFIICVGDYANADKIRRLIFKIWTDKPWYEVVGKKKAKEMSRKSYLSGIKVLKEIDDIGKKAYIIFGNSDFYKEGRNTSKDPLIPGFYEEIIKKSKNLKLLDKKIVKDELGMLGYGGYVDSTMYIKNPFDKDKKKQIKRLKRYVADEIKLLNLFKKIKTSKNLIFVTHYPPFRIFDKVSFAKNSPMYGKHVGWEPYNKIIKNYQPKLVLCGHMHEHQGRKKLGKSLIVSVGCAAEGRAAVIDWPNLKVRFLK